MNFTCPEIKYWMLKKSFYRREDVTLVARELLGKVLVTHMDRRITAGIIVETEAYSWQERGCHAWNNRMTPRNAPMFEPGGIAYVYRCYGIHNLLNLVTGQKGSASAVLIRALEPVDGLKWMERRSADVRKPTSGPGKLTRAMGITDRHDRTDLITGNIWVEDRGVVPNEICAGARIGIDYAGDDARLPWRFTMAGNRWVSR